MTAVTAAAAAAAAGAAQLGVAYGTGMISWLAMPARDGSAFWLSSLTWAAWIAAVSTVVGAVLAGRRLPEPSPDRSEAAARSLVPALAAAIGALVTVALVAPAREVAPAVATDPHATAALHTLVGALVGAVAAVGAMASRAVATNVLATAGWVWALAVATVTRGALAGRDPAPVPLAYMESGPVGPWLRGVSLTDSGVALAAVLLVGLLAALPAARRLDHPVGVVTSGAAGPALLVVAYLLAQPDLTTAGALELSRQLAVPYLALVGLVGSSLAYAFPRRTSRPAAQVFAPVPTQPTDPDGADAPELDEPAAPTGGGGAVDAETADAGPVLTGATDGTDRTAAADADPFDFRTAP